MTEWILSSSVLICAMMVLRKLMKGKVNPRLQYALWAIVLLRLLCPVSFFSSDLSVQNIHQQVLERPAVQEMYQAVTSPIVPTAPAVVPDNPVVTPEAQTQPQIQGPSTSVVVPDRTPTATVPRQEMPAVTTPEPSRNWSWKDILLNIWMGGMAVMGLWMIGCNFHFSRSLKRSRKAMEIAASPVEVYITKNVETPCLFGVFSPAVYLTPEAAEQETLRRYVLTHELTHYRQFDHVWSVLRGVALVIHWYNPLVWVAFRASRQDGEMACDEGTLEILGEAHRGDYGRALIALATQTRLRSTMVAATTIADGKKAMKERIVILMKHPKTTLITLIALILACTLIVGCTFTGAKPDTSEPEETNPTEPVDPSAPTGHTPTPDMSEDGQDLPIPDDPERDQRMEKAGFARLDRLLEGTDIRMTVDGNTIILSEDGLVLELSSKSLFAARNGYVVASLRKMPRLLDGTVYVYEEIFRNLFLRDDGTLSLFQGIPFFAGEILAALENPDASSFNRKLSDAVTLPASMGIRSPNVDVEKLFQSQLLADLPEELAEELEKLGYENPEEYSYTEYVILSGEQTLQQANLFTRLKGTIFGGKSHDQVMVAEYTSWEREESWKTYVENLSEAEKAFAQEKGITLTDLSYLDRLFNGAYMRQTDEVLKQTLEEYYAMNLGFISGQCTEPEPASPHPDATRLTAEQIEQVNEAFVSTITDENNFTSSTSISCFFTSFYSDPRDIDLEAFLRYFSAEAVAENWDGAVDDEEFAVLCQLENFPWKGIKSLQEMHVPVHKYPARVVDQVIYRYTGIRLNDLQDAQGRGSALYSSKYDNYYNFTSDFGPGIFRCVDGYIYDDYVVLYSADAVLTLTEQNGRYYIYSHVPLSWIEGVKLTTEQIAQVNEAFGFIRWDENGEPRMTVNPVMGFFTSYYSTPAGIDLNEFLRYFSAYGIMDYEGTVSEKEFLALQKIKGDEFPFYGLEDYEDAISRNAPIHRIPYDAVDAVISYYTGVSLDTLEDEKASSVLYLEEFDCYYNFTSDFGPGSFECIGGMDYGTYVELYSHKSILTLEKEGNHYYIVSHLPKS